MITEKYGNSAQKRGFSGQYIEEEDFKSSLKGDVFDSLVDTEMKSSLLFDLKELVDTGFDTDHLREDIEGLENPVPDDLRSWRIGEAFAEVILEQHFSCRFHWNELRDARNPKGNKTGADLVGFIEVDGDVLFLFGEVKTSSETRSVPPQVMTKSNGIENQLRDLYSTRRKRQLLISYLKSKTASLNEENPFKCDFGKAIKSYYHGDNKYQLIGVLVRDVEFRQSDVELSYNKISEEILEPTGLKLMALYTPVDKSLWQSIISEKV